jgi:hypothetical protein
MATFAVCVSRKHRSANFGQILAQPTVHGVHYAPLGVMLDKRTLFRAGGRPVIYQPPSEYTLLHESQRIRHKHYDPNQDVDFSWEREWRICTDEFPLNPNEVTLVVPNRRWSDYFFREHAGDLEITMHVAGDIGAYMTEKCPWHFIVLDDLGMPAQFDYFPGKGRH